MKIWIGSAGAFRLRQVWFVDTNLTWGEIMVNLLGIDLFFDEQKDIPVIIY